MEIVIKNSFFQLLSLTSEKVAVEFWKISIYMIDTLDTFLSPKDAIKIHISSQKEIVIQMEQCNITIPLDAQTGNVYQVSEKDFSPQKILESIIN